MSIKRGLLKAKQHRKSQAPQRIHGEVKDGLRGFTDATHYNRVEIQGNPFWGWASL